MQSYDQRTEITMNYNGGGKMERGINRRARSLASRHAYVCRHASSFLRRIIPVRKRAESGCHRSRARARADKSFSEPLLRGTITRLARENVSVSVILACRSATRPDARMSDVHRLIVAPTCSSRLSLASIALIGVHTLGRAHI